MYSVPPKELQLGISVLGGSGVGGGNGSNPTNLQHTPAPTHAPPPPSSGLLTAQQVIDFLLLCYHVSNDGFRVEETGCCCHLKTQDFKLFLASCKLHSSQQSCCTTPRRWPHRWPGKIGESPITWGRASTASIPGIKANLILLVFIYHLTQSRIRLLDPRFRQNVDFENAK